MVEQAKQEYGRDLKLLQLLGALGLQLALVDAVAVHHLVHRHVHLGFGGALER